ncbi:hypothetical protein MtrunA17_Chr2g0303041 [Medicago truncatula]|uniref:Transmembrane protein, putative n=1 Tax=Medicago truncatula TaxID=3880 RepID=G7ZW95_MEDTR|nr:transmembrane protein, putative [Medicago truncatula]KEH37769.1 transmembrane protein, putative [Medicago truncatula]RHN73851.1 hypothetical protein MtrunA17_Chr2g0303041 [Medicago truncatula]
MAFQKSYTMTLNPLMFLFCLLLVMTNFVTISGSRQFKNIPIKEKEVIGGGKVEDQVNPSKNYNIEKTQVDKNQLPPFPLPAPPLPIPTLPVPGVPRLPIPSPPLLPPGDIPGVPPLPVPSPPIE